MLFKVPSNPNHSVTLLFCGFMGEGCSKSLLSYALPARFSCRSWLLPVSLSLPVWERDEQFRESSRQLGFGQSGEPSLRGDDPAGAS